jgi:O-antigen/teichoic acid export membrane protein
VTRAGAIAGDFRHRVRRFAAESWGGYLVTAFAWTRMEVLFLELSWGATTVALFAVSVTLANLATQAPLLLTGGLLPHLSRAAATGTGRTPQETYAISVRMLALLVFPACLGAAAIAPSLVPAIYGKDFSDAVPSAMILLCGASITATSSVAFTYLLAMERPRFVFVAGGAAALLVIAVGVTLIPMYGVLAAATARAIIQVGVSVAAILYIWLALKCATPVASLLRLFAAALLCAIAAWACVAVVPGHSGIALAIVAGATVYAAGVRLLRAMPEKDAEPLFRALAILPWPLRIPATTTLRLMAA